MGKEGSLDEFTRAVTEGIGYFQSGEAETPNEMIIVFRYLNDSQVIRRDLCSTCIRREELESVRGCSGRQTAAHYWWTFSVLVTICGALIVRHCSKPFTQMVSLYLPQPHQVGIIPTSTLMDETKQHQKVI